MKTISINLVILIVAAIVVGGGAFFGGMTYAKAMKPSLNNMAGRQGIAVGNGTMMRFGGGADAGVRIANGGFTAGTVAATSANGFTVSLPNGGGSKVVIVASSTSIGKISQGSLQDVSDGSNVIVTGTTNSDGSITASSVQIRPEGITVPEFGGSARATRSSGE